MSPPNTLYYFLFHIIIKIWLFISYTRKNETPRGPFQSFKKFLACMLFFKRRAKKKLI